MRFVSLLSDALAKAQYLQHHKSIFSKSHRHDAFGHLVQVVRLFGLGVFRSNIFSAIYRRPFATISIEKNVHGIHGISRTFSYYLSGERKSHLFYLVPIFCTHNSRALYKLRAKWFAILPVDTGALCNP